MQKKDFDQNKVYEKTLQKKIAAIDAKQQSNKRKYSSEEEDEEPKIIKIMKAEDEEIKFVQGVEKKEGDFDLTDLSLPKPTNEFSEELGTYEYEIRTFFKAILQDYWINGKDSEYFSREVMEYVYSFCKNEAAAYLQPQQNVWDNKLKIEQLKMIKMRPFKFGKDKVLKGVEVSLREQLFLTYFYYEKEHRFRNKANNMGIFPVQVGTSLMYDALKMCADKI